MPWLWRVFDRSIKKPVYLEVRPNQNIRAFLCLNLAMIPILESIFNRNFTSWSFWDEHRSDAESVKILYNYSVELSKYAERINACSGILKFGVNPDQGKLVLKQAFFCRVRHCPVCQWRRSLLWRAVMFQQLPSIQERFPTHRWVFLTLTVKNPPVTELRDTLKHMNDSWQRLIQTKRFKSGVAGFFANNRSHQGEWWGHDGTSTLSCFAVG